MLLWKFLMLGDPLGTRWADMEKMVMSLGPDKRLVLVLNKIDLVPREAVEKGLKYLREELPAVAFKCSTKKQMSNLGWKSAPKAGKGNHLLQTSDYLGAVTLIELLKTYSRSHEIRKPIIVGIIGADQEIQCALGFEAFVEVIVSPSWLCVLSWYYVY